MNLHTYVCWCMMLYIILNNTIHRGRTKMEIKKGKKEQKYKYFNASCVTVFTFEIDADGKYLSPKSLL